MSFILLMLDLIDTVNKDTIVIRTKDIFMGNIIFGICVFGLGPRSMLKGDTGPFILRPHIWKSVVKWF